MRFFEYRSEVVHIIEKEELEQKLNEWGKEGWDVLSVLVPRANYWSEYRVTAKREILAQRQTGRKFR